MDGCIIIWISTGGENKEEQRTNVCLYVQYSDEDMYDLAIALGYGCSSLFRSEKFLEPMPRTYRFSTSSGISHLAFLTRGLAALKRTLKPFYQGRQAKDRSLREKRERSAYLYGHNLNGPGSSALQTRKPSWISHGRSCSADNQAVQPLTHELGTNVRLSTLGTERDETK